MSGWSARLALVWVGALLAGAGAGAAAAQTPVDRPASRTAAGPTEGDATITAANLLRHAAVLAHDSMRDRAAPTPALERTARYIADQFRQFGLAPYGDFKRSGPVRSASDTIRDWIQRYPAAGHGWLDKAQSRVVIVSVLAARGKQIVEETGAAVQRKVAASFDTAAYFATPTAVVPARDRGNERRALLVAGRHTAASLRQADLRNAQVIFVPPADQDSARLAPVLTQLRTLSHGLVVLSATDSAAFAARMHAARRAPLRRTDDYMREASSGSWAAEISPAAFRDALAAAGLDLAELRATATPVVRPLPFTQVYLLAYADPARADTTTVPNVIGRLEGTDSALRRAVLVVSAHMEHTGGRAGAFDSAAGGIDQNITEVAGLLAVAEAVTRSGLRPRRPVIFLASSGGAPGRDDWGSNYFIDDRWGIGAPSIGLHLALERLRRPAGDTLLVAGTQEFELSQLVGWILAAHPEPQLAVVDESASACSAAGCWTERSAFGRFLIPSLAVNSGYLSAETGRAEPSGMDTSALPDAEREARALRFAYHLVEDLASMSERPRRSATGRSRQQSQDRPSVP